MAQLKTTTKKKRAQRGVNKNTSKDDATYLPNRRPMVLGHTKKVNKSKTKQQTITTTKTTKGATTMATKLSYNKIDQTPEIPASQDSWWHIMPKESLQLPHSNVIKPRNFISLGAAPAVSESDSDNENNQGPQPILTTNLHGPVPEAFKNQPCFDAVANEADKVFFCRLSMLLLEFIGNIGYSLAVLTEPNYANIKLHKKLEAFIKHVFVMVSIVYGMGTCSFSWKSHKTIQGLKDKNGNPVAFKKAKKMLEYIKEHYFPNGVFAIGTKCEFTYDSVQWLNHNCWSFRETANKNLGKEGIVSTEFLYQQMKVQSQPPEVKWVQGYPFVLCIGLAKLWKDFASKCAEHTKYLTEPQKEFLKSECQLLEHD
jgi:hypothetical protein